MSAALFLALQKYTISRKQNFKNSMLHSIPAHGRFLEDTMSHISDITSRQQKYLAGIAVAMNMLDSALIDESDYSAFEKAFAEKFQPLFRYESPCFSSEKAITLEHNICDTGKKERLE